MGSLVSKPKAPSRRGGANTIIQQMPIDNSTFVSSSETSGDVSESVDVLTSEARSQNLLRRNRGRFGTILTGFRGAFGRLDEQALSSKRKTLLGE